MNHRCSDVRERLGAYLDGELDAGQAREIEQHLDGCSSCRSALEEMRLTDRHLREVMAGEEPDIERSEHSLNETLARIRREPSPAWEPEPPKPRCGRSFGWGWRLRWAAGIAAATAAVFLALRIGPEPMAPEKLKRIPPQETKGPSGGEEEKRVVAPPVMVADADKPVGTDEVGGSEPPAAAEPRSKGPASESSEERAHGFLEERAPTTVAAETKWEGTAEPEEFTRRVRRGEAEPLQTDAPDEPATVVMDKKARTQESIPHRAMGATERSQDVLLAGEAPTGGHGLQVNESDTLGPTDRWPERLEAETRHLQSLAELERNRGERARRWRTIGDLWEWIGRKENSPEAFAKAFEAYQIAAEIDPRSAALDSTRVRRARLRSAEEIQGNILPAQR